MEYQTPFQSEIIILLFGGVSACSKLICPDTPDSFSVRNYYTVVWWCKFVFKTQVQTNCIHLTLGHKKDIRTSVVCDVPTTVARHHCVNNVTSQHYGFLVCVCVCVCVCVRARARVCVCVCVWMINQTERESTARYHRHIHEKRYVVKNQINKNLRDCPTWEGVLIA